MKYNLLDGTGLYVSEISLGTMTFGKEVDKPTAHRLMSKAIEDGINLIDTADLYNAGVSEKYIGEWLKNRRSEVLLATKAAFQIHDRVNSKGLSKYHIVNAVEDSLRRLQTDHIDIFYLHLPDYSTRIEETIIALKLLLDQGKIRYYGMSNYSSWQTAEFVETARKMQVEKPLFSQNVYNLITRGIEPELLPCLENYTINLTTYNPLAAGLLTGKYHLEQKDETGRLTTNPMYRDRYFSDVKLAATSELMEIASGAGLTITELAFKWVLQHKVVKSMILGVSSMEQYETNMRICSEDPTLSPEVVEKCDAVYRRIPVSEIFSYLR